jgi:hypothetical protein
LNLNPPKADKPLNLQTAKSRYHFLGCFARSILSKAIADKLVHIAFSMAGGQMARPDRFEQRFFCQATIDGKRTAGVKPAPCRRVYRAGHISGKYDAPWLVLDIRNRNA